MGLGAAILIDGEPDAELGGAASIEVYECLGEMTTYRLRYATDIREGDFPLLQDGRLSVGSELTIAVEVDGQLSCLVKGPVYAQEIKFIHGGAGSYVDVLGADRSIMIDRNNIAVLWDDVTDSDAVRSILEDHFDDTDIDDTTASHSESKHVLVQRETDLAFVRRLARRNGYLFWVTCDQDGQDIAHFKRLALDAEPAAELQININPPTIESLELSWDVERPNSAEAAELDLLTKSDIDGAVPRSPLVTLGAASLSDIARGERAVHLVAPVDDAGDLTARTEAALIDAGFFVRARCATSTHVLKKVIRAHTMVQLSGVGSRHSGKYLCSEVRHVIDPAAHRMDLVLLRNAWGA